MMQADVFSIDALTASDRAEWQRLAQGVFASPLLQPGFAELVASERDDVRIAAIRKGTDQTAFLAYHLRPGRLARSLAAPFSDLQALVSAPDFPITGEETLKAANIRAFQFDALLDPYHLFSPVDAPVADAHVIAPGPDAAVFLEQQRAAHAKRFKNHRRLANQLEREKGEISVIAGDADTDALERLFRWKRDQYAVTGRHDVLAAAWVKRFMRRVHEKRDGQVQGLFVSLRAKGEIIAGLFGVRSDTVFNPWIAAYDPAFSAWSPGQQVLHELVALMPQLGLERCDIGADHDHYKKYYASGSQPVRSALISAPGRDTALTKARSFFWESAEQMPGARLATRLHRRFNQISAVELHTGKRISGLVRAVTQRRTPLNPAA